MQRARLGHLIGGTSLLFLLFAGELASQPRPGPPDATPQPMFCQPVLLFTADSSRARIDIPIRIDESFFVAVRNTDTSFHYAFRRSGELLVELTDSLEGSVARDLGSIVIGSDSDEAASGPRRWYEALLSFEVKPGSYTIDVDVTDLESHRHFNDHTRHVRPYLPHRDSVAVSDPIFIRWSDSTMAGRHILPLNFGGDLLFGAPSGMLLEVRGFPASDSMVTVRYTIKPVPPSPEDLPETHVTDSLAAPLIRGHRLQPERDRNDYMIAEGRTGDPALLVAPFPAERLPLRTYLVTITIGNGSHRREFSVPARMVWPDMPRSMRDVDYALSMLRYIVPPRTLDSLKSGDFEERRKNLESFWKARDATPGTAYNEVMTEYYRRVDHAMRAFSTLHVADGAASDRGRIYILYGPPTTTKRTLNPFSFFEEVWYYDRLKKEFTFVDRSRNGNYELVLPERP